MILAGGLAFLWGCADEQQEEKKPPKTQYPDQTKALVGRWVGRGLQIELNEGGKGEVNGVKVYWEAVENRVTIAGSGEETALKGTMWSARQRRGTLTLKSLENKKRPPILLKKQE